MKNTTNLVASKQKTVIICPDIYNKDTWSTAQVDDVCAYLAQQFAIFPENTRIYHNTVTQQTDVTPKRPQDIEQLQSLDGTFYVVIYPSANPLLIIYYAVVAIITAYTLYTVLTMPKPQGQQAGSSNNELQNRTNKARLKGRIPDIYGTQRSYPDLLGVTYTYYSTAEEDREIEEAIMCIGRGYYQIHDVKDADTIAEGIQGFDVSIYNPDSNITGTPFYQAGESFTTLPLAVTKSASINGQSLKTPSDDLIIDNTTIYFETAGVIKTADTALDFTENFKAGDGIEITGATFGVVDTSIGGTFTAKDDYTLEIATSDDIVNYSTFQSLELVGAVFTYDETVGGVTTTHVSDLSGKYQVSSVSRVESGGVFTYTFSLVSPKQVNYNWNFVTNNSFNSSADLGNSTLGASLDGIYSISSISADQITLANVTIINPEWSKIDDLYGGSTAGVMSDITLSIVENKWVGWFNIDDPEATQITANFYFPQGLYTTTDSGKTRSGWIDIAFQYQSLDENDNPISTVKESVWQVFRTTKNSFGVTYRVTLPKTGKFRFRIAKIAEKDWNRPVNECKVKDVYATHTLNKSRYSDVTVVRTRQVATDGALSLKERKLNCLVTRKLKVDGTGALVATRDAGQAIINMALDKHEGRRSSSEIDTDQILAEILKISTYFKSTIPTEFNYTFDDSNVSFEEAVGMVASAVFCESYRFGNKLRIRFEQPQASSVLLFNHRNKVIGSEKRTYKFGIDKDYDGIKIEYTSPDDDERVNYYLSYDASTDTVTEDDSATNPLEITTSGIRSHAVAKIRAWREWNKLRYHTVSCEFTGLDESHLLIRNDRILNCDNTEVDVQDGQVERVDGLTLTLSQEVEFIRGVTHYCHLQLSDGTVEVIEVTAGEFVDQVNLVRAPRLPLVYDDDRYVKTLYTIVRDDEAEREAFMMTELTPNDAMTNKLTCINYSDDYYKNDHDFI